MGFRKNNRQHSMMRSKSFKTQEVRKIGLKEAGVRIFFNLVDGSNKCRRSHESKEMQRLGMIEGVKKKMNARARQMLQDKVGNCLDRW